MKKNGFTLAEVLITLGIIGVVAALVMPALIANYKKQVYVTQLKKTISAWEQGMNLMLATDGVDYLGDTEFARVLLSAGQYGYNGTSAALVPESTDILKKYFKIIKIEDAAQYSVKYLNGTSFPFSPGYRKFYMADGSVYYVAISFGMDPTTDNISYGDRIIDVNGDKGPNLMGRDIFGFRVNNKGMLIPYNSEQVVPYGQAYWRDTPSSCGVAGSSDMTGVNGIGCAARIIENGWVMDY